MSPVPPYAVQHRVIQVRAGGLTPSVDFTVGVDTMNRIGMLCACAVAMLAGCGGPDKVTDIAFGLKDGQPQCSGSKLETAGSRSGPQYVCFCTCCRMGDEAHTNVMGRFQRGAAGWEELATWVTPPSAQCAVL
jgi:hypothetical protein